MALITNLQLSINGTEISLVTDGVTISEIVTYEKNGPSRLSFTHEAVLPTNITWSNAEVVLKINNALVFGGRIRDRQPVIDNSRGYIYLYTAIGYEYHGTDIPVVSPFDGTGTLTFNLESTAVNYDPTYAGKTIGEMIRIVLEQENTRASLQANWLGRYTSATANGTTTWSIDSRTAADLSSDSYLSAYRPTKPVTFEGDSLFDSIRSVLGSIAPNHEMWIQYVEESTDPDDNQTTLRPWGIIRFSDLRTRTTTLTHTIGEHPAPQLRRDYSNSFSRVTIRGGPNIQPYVLDLSNGDLTEHFDSAWYLTNSDAKDDWTLATWTEARGQTVEGECWCRRPRTANEADPQDPAYIADPKDPQLASDSWILIDPSDNALTWAEDQWSQGSGSYAGYLYLYRDFNGGWRQTVNRLVVYNTELAANGTSHLQIDSPLPNTDFGNVVMTAKLWPGIQTWRRYKIETKTEDGKPIGRYAQAAFATPVPWTQTDGTALSFTQSAVGQVLWSSDGNLPLQYAMCGVKIDRESESVIFDRPVVTFFGDQVSLQTGGANVTGQPVNLRVLLPVSLAALETTVPADTVSGNVTVSNYEGTSSTVDGSNRTMVVNLPEWVSDSDSGVMSNFARQILDSVKDTVIEGSVFRYTYQPVFGPTTGIEFVDPCHAINPLSDYTTDISGCLVKFNHGQSGTVLYHTEYAMSNKRAQNRGFEGFLHPVMLESGWSASVEYYGKIS